MTAPYRIELLGNHGRSNFACGSDALDSYFREQAKQDMRRRVASCFVAVDLTGQVAGYYTLSASSIVMDLLPAEQRQRLPKYPAVPAVLLGRLAVSQCNHGMQLGGALVADALLRATRSDVMIYAMIVDAEDDQAALFYEHLGFERLGDAQHRLIRALPIRKVT